jgi:hypothetical protein
MWASVNEQTTSDRHAAPDMFRGWFSIYNEVFFYIKIPVNVVSLNPDLLADYRW